ELRQVQRAKLGDPRQHPAGTAQREIRAPHLPPVALHDDAALDPGRIAKSERCRLGAERGFEAGSRYQEDLEVAGGHLGSAVARRRDRRRRIESGWIVLGWGARIRTWDGGTKTRCLTAWLRPNARAERNRLAGNAAPSSGGRHHSQRAARPQLLSESG